jgi:uncharacterized protein (DUF4415 family)
MPKTSDSASLRARALKSLSSLSPDEEEKIAAGIAQDDENPEFGEVFFVKAARGRGPQKSPTKHLVSLRLDDEVIEHFRSGGRGWQTRMNEALRKAAGI